ncbi:3-phosphoserine/phosphohydroxythreonine transaminase [Spirochaeta cellobiosiphila]|uniref:3-phosphoserine/phosphohydroxythreonine transaminase n=1 Tax=Spirochaeta cellobiosiphila TaxID=504483 RepID=UPI0003F9C525|nr:3-phosphoserine/phosphohydroxythreonine transaminase [Spirochaeta cellobiosiphila]
MDRVFNFSAGPSCLPERVLQKASEQMLNYKGSGMSVMEMSHRSKWFDDIIKETEQLYRDNMNIPDNYKVLFLQGGASLQFTMIPQNLFGKNKKAGYINTGAWSKKAMKEAKIFGEVIELASSEDKVYNYIPEIPAIPSDLDYVHITYNNTIYGTVYKNIPQTKDIPLVADTSSGILSAPLDVSQFGLIYAGAQKNLGPAGVAVVIIREDLIGNALDKTPTFLNYKTHSDAGSLFNTPPCYSIYVLGLVQKWIKEEGGPEAIYKANEEKASLLYNYLDNSDFFKGTVVKKDRSLMNVPFLSPSDELNAKFVKEATALGMENLKGHRTVGGMRASIYNAMPLKGVTTLIDFMKKFEQENK